MSVEKAAKLVMVTVENNNKFYDMEQMTNGDISIVYGRVGSKGKNVLYPSGKKSWSTLYNSKKRKGYQDVTELKIVAKDDVVTTNLFDGVDSKEVINLVEYLMECSRTKIKENYTISTDNVTTIQIKRAWEIIDNLVPLLVIGQDVKALNDELLSLYVTIPRSMKRVQDNILRSMSTDADIVKARTLLDNEQSLLSTLESQIRINKTTITADVSKNNKNILDEMGISIEIETDAKQLKYITKILGENAKYTKRIFKVKDFESQKRYDSYMTTVKDPKEGLLWHGSRNENWLGILQKGLMIRPSNAIIQGAMFGNGMYFANRSQKAVGYTSLKGSHWTSGGSSKGFISLYSVHMGKSKDIHSWDRKYTRLHQEATKAKWDSVFAHAGRSLRNDEIIVYKTEQATISYLIEMNK